MTSVLRMSDGPHRTLPMRPHWKQVAQRAHNTAYDQEELHESLQRALVRDWSADGPQALYPLFRSILEPVQAVLFNDDTIAQLERLRNRTTGQPFAELFLDSTIIAVKNGHSSDNAIRVGAHGAITARIDSVLRQIEEHYIRMNSAITSLVRHRIEGVLDSYSTSLTAIESYIPDRHHRRSSSRKTELDDGIRLA